MDATRLVFVAAARPNLVKIAPLIRAVARHNAAAGGSALVEHILVHTGQHYAPQMSGDFFRDLDIPAADYNLGVGSGSFAHQDGLTMMRIEDVLLAERPDWVVVVGDVNGTMATAVNARKHGFNVAHVEAGLRSGDWTMPEEINRVITDRLAHLLFTTCPFADRNLAAEAVDPRRIRRVGNIMIDTLEAKRAAAAAVDVHAVIARKSATPTRHIKELADREYAVLTMHRPSNVDHPEQLRAMIEAFIDVAARLPIIFPLHPRTTARAAEFGCLDRLTSSSGLIVTEPLSYTEMLALNLRARAIFTDSGGLQDESSVLGVPCFTMRENTERPATLEANGGTSRLIGGDPAAVRACAAALPPRREDARPDLWDGHTAERIIAVLAAGE